jgi:hypothetical protein
MLERSGIDLIAPSDIIESINGVSIEGLYRECMSYTGGIKTFQNHVTSGSFPLYLFFSDSVDPPYSIKLRNRNEEILYPGMDVSEYIEFARVQDAPEDYTFEVLDGKIGLITYNVCQNPKAFKKFLKNTFKQIEKDDIKKLIIDLRRNGGGNSELNDELLGYLTQTPYQQSSARYWKVSRLSKKAYSTNPIYSKIFGKAFMERYMNTPIDSVMYSEGQELFEPIDQGYLFTGRTCFLIGPGTFSSANFLADAVKTYELATLIGLPTGEFTNDFGEQIQFYLPHSKCEVFVSSTYDIGANGDAETLAPVIPDIVSEDALNSAILWLRIGSSDN